MLAAIEAGMEAVNKEANKEQLAWWRLCAGTMAEGGGRKAHLYSRKPTPGPAAKKIPVGLLPPLPVAGQAAVQQVINTWQPMWQHPDRKPRAYVPQDEPRPCPPVG